MSLIDNLNQIKTCKEEIKNAIESKGVDMTNVPLTSYAGKIAEISGGSSSPSGYTGHVDEDGLRQLGWSESDIERLKSDIDWNEEDDHLFAVKDYDKAKPADVKIANDGVLRYTKYIDTSNTNIFYSNFSNNYSLISIPLLDTSNATSMGSMFYRCFSLKTVPQLDTHNVTDMSSMFQACYSLKSIPQLDTHNVTGMSSMFYNCYLVKTIPSLDTLKVTNMGNMFYNCYSLKSVPQLDTSKVTNMGSMFRGCSVLREVNGIDFSSMTASPTNFLYSVTSLLLTHFIVNGSISFSWTDNYGFKILTNIDYESIKSILVAMSKCTNPETAKTMTFALTINEQEGTTLSDLVADCQSKGWTINGLTIV